MRVCLCCSVLFLGFYDVSVCGFFCHCIIYLFALLCFYGFVGLRSWVVVILYSFMLAAVRFRGFVAIGVVASHRFHMFYCSLCLLYSNCIRHSFWAHCDLVHAGIFLFFLQCSTPCAHSTLVCYLQSMVLILDERLSLPDIQHGLGLVRPRSPQRFTGLNDSDPFCRPPPLKRKWSQKIDNCQVLPLHASKSKILQAIAEHQVVLLTAPPASGKTTQVPQMVLDDALEKKNTCRIVVSNPKTLAVMGCSRHVSTERGEATMPVSVGYSTKRRKRKPNSLDSILYVTEGTLLHILDNALFTHIFIDEVHERTVEVDVLLMKIRTLLNNGCNVKVIVMSATADTSFILDYFQFQSKTILDLPTKSFPIRDYWLNDLPDCPHWRCPSEIIVFVYTTFKNMTHAEAFIIFLAEKKEIEACQVKLASPSYDCLLFFIYKGNISSLVDIIVSLLRLKSCVTFKKFRRQVNDMPMSQSRRSPIASVLCSFVFCVSLSIYFTCSLCRPTCLTCH